MDGIFAGNSLQKQRNVFVENCLPLCRLLSQSFFFASMSLSDLSFFYMIGLTSQIFSALSDFIMILGNCTWRVYVSHRYVSTWQVICRRLAAVIFAHIVGGLAIDQRVFFCRGV